MIWWNRSIGHNHFAAARLAAVGLSASLNGRCGFCILHLAADMGDQR
jgi:hypothetical protein